MATELDHKENGKDFEPSGGRLIPLQVDDGDILPVMFYENAPNIESNLISEAVVQLDNLRVSAVIRINTQEGKAISQEVVPFPSRQEVEWWSYFVDRQKLIEYSQEDIVKYNLVKENFLLHWQYKEAVHNNDFKRQKEIKSLITEFRDRMEDIYPISDDDAEVNLDPSVQSLFEEFSFTTQSLRP